MNRIPSLLRNSSGATSIEYAAIASLISIIAIGAIEMIGTSVTTLFASIPAF
jgi:pilus assembly protein Flp/PilA